MGLVLISIYLFIFFFNFSSVSMILLEDFVSYVPLVTMVMPQEEHQMTVNHVLVQESATSMSNDFSSLYLQFCFFTVLLLEFFLGVF